MANAFTKLLNHSVKLGLDNSGTPDTISVRLTDVDPESCVEINGINWGLQRAAAEVDFDDFDFGQLYVIRNDVFDVSFSYINANVHAVKDVVFEDSIVREAKFRCRDFKRPIKLQGYSNYLIIMGAPVRIANPTAVYTALLTVRGRFIYRDYRATYAANFN